MTIAPAVGDGGQHGKVEKAVLFSCAVGLTSASVNSIGAEKFDFGKREYETNCAVCHGKDAKGLGPYAGLLSTRIPDLSTLSQRNKGVFPVARVQEIIDGRQALAAHGPKDMPIWGARYLESAAGSYMDVPYDYEAYVRTRILALTEYIYRLQAK